MGENEDQEGMYFNTRLKFDVKIIVGKGYRIVQNMLYIAGGKQHLKPVTNANNLKANTW